MSIPRCRVEPLGDFQFGFKIGEAEVTRWCFSPLVPRPYFFPINGPSGLSLTRMGHPGAPNHDHHRSLWFAHNDLMGQDFWAEGKPGRITQTQWYAIEESDALARLALELHWTDGHDPKPIVRQDLFITVRPLSPVVDQSSDPSAPTSAQQVGPWSLELQADFRAGGQGVAFHKSNFGILGLRVAKSLSVVFGAGVITGSDGLQNEPALFGQPNRWIDFSGPIRSVHSQASSEPIIEGVTLIDHRANLNHPAKWHVRDDGWCGPSLARDADVPVDVNQPLTLRYLLVVHPGTVPVPLINEAADAFDASPSWRVVKGTKPHHQWELSSSEPG